MKNRLDNPLKPQGDGVLLHPCIPILPSIEPSEVNTMAYSETESTTGRSTGSETRHEAQKTVGEVKHEAREAAGEMKQEMQHLTQEARERGKALFEGQRRAAADEIGGMVQALRKTQQELDREDKPSTSELVGRAASALDRVAGTLRNQDFRGLVGQVESYARQHPGMFFGGSVVAGLLLARFLKSSAEGQPYASRYRGASGRQWQESRPVF
jgi:hypothetical protein